MGFGLSPMGLFAYGSGTPLPADQLSDNVTNARYISVNNGDFLALDDGSLADMPPIRQRVILALATEKGSAAGLEWLGITLPKKIDAAFETAARNAVRLALYQLLEVEKVIRLDAVIVEKLTQGRVVLNVSYTQLDNKESTTVALG